VKYLLDTHVFLWLVGDSSRVDAKVRERLADTRDELLVSAASAWELAIKHGSGRLELPGPPATYVPSRVQAIGASSLPVELGDALAVADLPPHHADPFDRLLVAQAQRRELVLVTADRALSPYDVQLLWAD